MPKVSVIVPNYNHARFLPQRLESILSQTYQDFELIFLDDASSDNSKEVFEKYQDDYRIKSQFNTENSGSPFIQWNRGIEMASGEYIWIAESDDFCDEDFLDVLVPLLDENPTVGLAYCQSWIVSESGEKVKAIDWYHVFGGGLRWSHDFKNEGRDEICRYLAIQNTIPNASAVLIRKSILNQGLRADENMKICGDWLFWVNMLINSDVVFSAKPRNCFRQIHAGSQRKKMARLGLESIETFKIQKRILDTVNPDRKFRKRMFNHHLRRWASLSFHELLSADYDQLVYQEFISLYDQEKTTSISDRVRIRIYYYLIVPGMKTWIYRTTIGHWRKLYLRRKGVIE